MKFEVTLRHSGFLDWDWALYRLDENDKRIGLASSGYGPFKWYVMLEARSTARSIRKKAEWHNKNYSKKI